MKKIINILLLMLGINFLGLCQNSFELSIDTEEDCIVWEGINDDEGNAVIVGGIGEHVPHDYEGYILKVFPDGSYIEKRFVKEDTIGFFSTIKQLDNGNYFITGCYSSTNDYDVRDMKWVVILDSDLNLLVEKSYKVRDGYIGFGGTTQSIIDYEGNIIVATTPLAEDKDEKTNFSDLGFYKFTPDGDTLLSKYYSYMFDDLPFEFKQLPFSNDIMLIAKTQGGNLVYIDTDLNIIKENQFIDSHVGGQDPSSDFWINDTSFLISGKRHVNGDDCLRVEAMDTSARVFDTLNINKVDTLDYPAWKKSMAYANDTTIYIGGFTPIIAFWTTDPTIVELYVIDKYLNVLGNIDLGGDAYYEIWGIIAMQDDGCLLYGTSYTNPEVAERDVHIWKVLREDIELLVSVRESNNPPKEIRLYPNPVKEKLTIDLGKNRDWNQLRLSITSIEGKTVFKKHITEKGNLLEADLSSLKSGIYIIQIEKENQIIYSEKIIKQ